MRMISRLFAAIFVFAALISPLSSFAATPFSIGSNITGVSGNNITLTTTADAPAGAGVVVFVQVVGGSWTVNGITDSVGGNTWSSTTQLNSNTDRYRMYSTILTNALPSGSVLTVSFGNTGTSFRVITAAAITGVSAQDANVAGTGGASSSRSISLPTLASNNEVVFVGIGTRSSITNPITEASGYAVATTQPSPSDNYAMQISYRIVSSNVADTPSWSWSASVQNGMQAMSFVLQGACAPKRSLLGAGC